MNVSYARNLLEDGNKFPDDEEPVFLLRGRDPLTEATILFWVREAIRTGVNTRKIHGAVSVAADCQAWKSKRQAD